MGIHALASNLCFVSVIRVVCKKAGWLKISPTTPIGLRHSVNSIQVLEGDALREDGAIPHEMLGSIIGAYRGINEFAEVAGSVVFGGIFSVGLDVGDVCNRCQR